MNGFNTANTFVVDVCGTLVKDDTTLGLLRHFFARDSSMPIRHLAFSLLTSRFSPVRMCVALAEKITGQHILKHLVIRLLSGCSVAALGRSAEEYADFLLNERKVRSVWSVINVQGPNIDLVLASASLDSLVERLASKLGARYVASTLEQRNGFFTGRYSADVTGKKLQALGEKYGASVLQRGFICVSDNYTDRGLLQRAHTAYVVLHREAHRARWSGLRATFLGVDE